MFPKFLTTRTQESHDTSHSHSHDSADRDAHRIYCVQSQSRPFAFHRSHITASAADTHDTAVTHTRRQSTDTGDRQGHGRGVGVRGQRASPRPGAVAGPRSVPPSCRRRRGALARVGVASRARAPTATAGLTAAGRRAVWPIYTFAKRKSKTRCTVTVYTSATNLEPNHGTHA